MLLEGVEMMDDVISSDRAVANVLLRVDDNGSADIMSLARRAEEWWANHGAAAFDARATGIMFEFARAEDAIAYGQIVGLSVALASIAVILFLIFRDTRLALVGLVPNAMPLVMIFGLMNCWIYRSTRER